MTQLGLYKDSHPVDRVNKYPQMRYMGSKFKLVTWIREALKPIEFSSALDAFSGSGVVSYLLKCMNKKVYSNDFLNFSSVISKGLIENNSVVLSEEDLEFLFILDEPHDDFIQKTFQNVFFSKSDLKFLDRISHNISKLQNPYKEALAKTALFRSCLKKQPRGVFTISGDLTKYNDGRRDLQLSLEDHFKEQVPIYNQVVFDNHKVNKSFNSSVFSFDQKTYHPELVYFDPPYVPRSDDNCYVKRYHFLEGLSKYWEGERILKETKVKKIEKKYTPFSYRKTSINAFDQMFSQFSKSILVLSYSSNAFPDLDTLVSLMKNHKSEVEVKIKPHKYHFGNHKSVTRSAVNEYLIMGID